ncbi:MAG: DUF1232 domain-containing protein [Chloroflexaceae bacterium]|nr:DUF1232 domain-containing protein [Chloroflexaceae bacterium]
MSNPGTAIYQWYRSIIRNPQYRWWVILGTLLYLLSPIDISPDLIPIIGQIDDIAILTLLVAEISQVMFDFIKNRQIPRQPVTEAEGRETVDVSAVSLK